MYVVRQSEQHFIDVLYTDIIVNPNLLVFPLLSPPPPPHPPQTLLVFSEQLNKNKRCNPGIL